MRLALQLDADAGYGFKILPCLVHDLFQLFMHDPSPLDAMHLSERILCPSVSLIAD